MKACSKDRLGLLTVTSFCDRPEREIFLRLASHVRVFMLCDPANPGQDDLRNAGVEIIPFSMQKESVDKLADLIKAVVREQSIDAVYAPRTETLSITIKALKNTDTRIVGYRGTTGHLSLVDVGPRRTYTDRRIDTIVCVSEAVRTYLMSKGIPSEKLVTVPKGHDPNWYKPADRAVLHEAGVPPDAFTIGFAGRIRRIKGVSYLVAALRRIPDELNPHLLLAGDIDDYVVKAMLLNASTADRVHCLGFRQDAPALMGACDAFVMPSLKREGLPRALVEAMAQEVPVVASNVGGIPELIEDGVSGILVPPRSPSAIAEALTSIAVDRQRSRDMGRDARKRVEEHFNIDATAKKMLELLADD